MTTRSLTRGGLKLETHKQRSTTRPLRIATIPGLFVLPLDQHAGKAARPLVTPGARVARGEPIAEPVGEVSAGLHAPASGRIRSIEVLPSPTSRSGSLCIVLENDGANRSFDAQPALPADADSQALRQHIARGGIVGLGGATFPTGPKLIRAGSANAHLIVNGAECEPWISCDDTLMRERAADVVAGVAILCRALQADTCTIAVEDDMVAAARALREAVKQANSSARIVEVPSIYPAGGERQLITTVTGFEVPSGGLPQDIGIVCQNVGTAAAIARWIRDGEPLIRRIVTVTGSAIHTPANLDAYIGTPIATLIDDCGGYRAPCERLIMGGTMMGIALPDDAAVIVKGTNCIVGATAADLQPPGPERPCIRCGSCSEACPAFLLPQELHRFALAGEVDALHRYGLLDCIECGCCDYVCPSQIPLVERFRTAKPELDRHLAMRAQAPLAKASFDKLADKRKSITNKP
jgi:electron transport complex protein RnfC